MKKILMALVATGMMATSAMALEGLVTLVRVTSDGTIKVKVGESIKPLAGTPEAIKAMYAAALTAQTSGAMVVVFADTDGAWKQVEIK